MNSESNKKKSIHGAENKKELQNMLTKLLDEKCITDVQKDFRIGSPTVSNESQFYAPFMIQFSDRTRWVIFSTTSMRTDRIKGQQWDAFNLKNLDTSINRAILAYPPKCKDKTLFKKQHEKYKSCREISSIDDVLSFYEVIKEARNEASNILKKEFNVSTVSHTTKIGKIWDAKGKNFESYVSDILSNNKYLTYWKNSEAIPEDNDYCHFTKILDAFSLNPKSVLAINATSSRQEIGYLPSGGSPKTDVLVTVTDIYKNDCLLTISCKHSQNNHVSVHQYKADTFADVLNRDDKKLRRLLNVFQYYGNIKDLPSGIADDLKSALNPYLRELSLWVMGGNYGEGNEEKQWAKYIVTYQTTKNLFSANTIDNYCNLIQSNKGTFGTPFSWTYASGQRGRSIQLKAPMI